MSDILTPQDFFRQKLREAGFCDDVIESTKAKQAAAVSETDTSPKGIPFSLSSTLIEGALKAVAADRYERNRAARQACIQAHGTTCSICGFDFAKTYGPEFAGIIQVHHIVPLHESAESHKVDPVHDLIPVCPNCHVALHAKPGGGTYTPDELRAILGMQSMPLSLPNVVQQEAATLADNEHEPQIANSNRNVRSQA